MADTAQSSDHTASHVHFPSPSSSSTTTTTTTLITSFTSISTSDSNDNDNDIIHGPIYDGRRNSQGEILVSPIETWSPNPKRRQSFKREEKKREVYKGEITVKDHREGDLGRGFTEGGEGSRII